MTEACAHQEVKGPDGARLVACAHGGHLLGWVPAPGPDVPDGDQLWLSPLARCGPGEAIRGGVPVIFPQFAGRGPLPKHGVARDRAWRLETSATGSAARVHAVLVADAATRAIWPHDFTLTMDAVASGSTLRQTLTVVNLGETPFTFTAALHTYLAVADAATATVHGVESAAAEDNPRDAAPVTLPPAPFAALGPRDVAVRRHRGRVAVVEGVVEDGVDARPGSAGGRVRRVEIDPGGFEDVVIWNPGTSHGLADVPADGASSFVCLEPAQLDPVTLAPGASWSATTQASAALVPLQGD